MHQNIPSRLILLWGADASINGFQICIWNFKIPNKCVFGTWIFFFIYTKPSWFKFYFMVFWWKGAEQPPKENFLAVQPVGWDGEFSEAFFIHNRHYNGSISDWKRGEQNGSGSGTGACGVPCRLAAQFHKQDSINKHLWKRGHQTAKGLYLRALVCLTKKTSAAFMMHNRTLESLPLYL